MSRAYWAYSWRRYLIKIQRSGSSSSRSAQSVPSPILRPACLTAVLGSRFFPHSSLVRHYTRQRSLQLVGTSCTFCVPFAAREYLLLDGPKLGSTSTLYTTITCVTSSGRSFFISSGTESDVDNVARGPDQQRSLDCFTQAMIDGSRKYPRSVLEADTILMSYGPANF